MADIIPIKPVEQKPSCLSCFHIFEKAKLDGGGYECRCNPPQVILVPANGGAALASVYPAVTDKMYCGLFEDIHELETAH